MKPRYASANAVLLILVFVCVITNGSTAAQQGGRLVVLRSPTFGWNIVLNLKIDGRTVANVVQGRRYDHVVPAGRHVLTVAAVPNLVLLSDIYRAERPSRADIRIHGIMGRVESRRSRPVSSASGASVLA